MLGHDDQTNAIMCGHFEKSARKLTDVPTLFEKLLNHLDPFHVYLDLYTCTFALKQ